MTLFDGIKHFTHPPHFHNDEEQRICDIIVASAAAIVVSIVVLVAYRMIVAEYELIIPLAIIGVCASGTIVLLQRGRVVLSAHLLSWSLLCTLLYLSVIHHGIQDIAVLALPGALVFSGLVLTRKWFLAYIILTLLSIAVIGEFSITGLLHTDVAGTTMYSQVFTAVVILAVTAFTVRLLLDNLLSSLRKAKENENAMRLQADQLQQTATVLHESEERFKLCMEAANDGLWDWNIATDDGYFSPAYYHMLGYEPGSFTAGGQAWREMIHPDDRKRVLQLNDDCIEGRTEHFEVEYRMKALNGEWRWILGRGKCIARDGTGRAVRLVGTHVDVTAHKFTEQLVHDMQRRESIGVLAGGIAHDYNNLLGVMMGNLSLAQLQLPVDHSAAKNIDRSLAAMERAAQLTQQILAFSGKGKFQISSIDLRAMLDEHKDLFHVSLPKNVKLIMHLPTKPVCIVGDPRQIEQVILNLIINGGEAIGEKQGAVSVTLSAQTMWRDELVHYSRITHMTLSEGAYALLEVADHGVGMNPFTLAKIFDPFFTTKFTGRGLGLSAVLGIIQGHNGGIIAESVEGTGTTIRVILPIINVPAASPETILIDKHRDAAALQAGTTTAPGIILVIDDEADVASMAEEILNTRNYTTLVELNPLRGIELFKQRHAEIGAVLLDMTMPEMSGKEVIDALQSIDPDVKIVITSGYSEEDVARKIAGVKVSGFIKKPYRLQSLLAMMEAVLASS